METWASGNRHCCTVIFKSMDHVKISKPRKAYYYTSHFLLKLLHVCIYRIQVLILQLL